VANMNYFNIKIDKEKIESQLKQKTQLVKEYGNSIIDNAPELSKKVVDTVKDSFPAIYSFMSIDELLKWTENISKSAATAYDKALDSEYLRTHIGGGNHRMFDGGHDLISAWQKSKDALDDDTFSQEVIGYVSAIWKDVTTVKGLPFFTWSKDAFEQSAEWVSKTIPYASKSWFYDLCSYDIFEIFSATLGTATALFLLNKDEMEKLSEILGSMGIVSILAANPLTGIAVIMCTTYAYKVKKKKLSGKKVAEGAVLSTVSIAIFSALGLPLLIELAIVITISKLLRNYIFSSNEIYKLIKSSKLSFKDKISKRYRRISIKWSDGVDRDSTYNF